MNTTLGRLPSIGVALLLACGLAACGGGGSDPQPPAPPNVTTGGGSVASDDGKATLTVPAGAASAPATVTLTADTGAAPPPEAMIVEGTRYRIGGDGGVLSADAQIELTAARAFPAGFRFGADARPRALFYVAPEAPCDVNGDYVIDEADASLWTLGYECFKRPRLVETTQLAPLADCVTPQGATITCNLPSLQPQLIGLQFDSIAPTVAVVSFDGPMKPQPVTQPGIYTLEVTATDNFGIARVDFYAVSTYRGNTTRSKVASATSVPYRGSIALSSADNGKVSSFIAEAVDSWGNVSGRGVGLVVDIPAPPPDDTTPPLVIAQAMPLYVQVGGALTITANASDNVGVVKIEFLKNGVPVAESATSPAALQVLSVSAADLGTVVYTIRAFDAAGNVGIQTLNLTVSPAAGEAWVHAGASDSNPGTAAAPFKTLAKAFATVGPNGTVWLAGTTVITPTSEGLTPQQTVAGLAVPPGVEIKAVAEDAPAIGIPLAFAAGGHLVDLRIDPSTGGRVLASGGVVTLNRVRWAASSNLTQPYGLVASGNALVTLGALGQPDFEYVLSGLVNLASVADTAELTVLEGRVDGAGQQGGFALDGTAKLRLENVTIVRSKGSWMSSNGVIYVGGTTNWVELIGTTIDLGGGLTTACIVQDRQAAGEVKLGAILLHGSTLANCGGGGIQLREGRIALGVANSTISGSGRYAIESGRIGFDSGTDYGHPGISISASQLSGNYLGSIYMNSGGSLGIGDSSLSGGARAITIEGLDKNYYIVVNRNSLAGNTEAVSLAGDASSVFGFGNGTYAGENVFSGGATLVRISVAAGATVHAVGNTWRPNVQGADASGHYGTALCGGASPCEVTAGSGANYIFDNAGAGAKLRLGE